MSPVLGGSAATAAWADRGAWVAGRSYRLGDVVTSGVRRYVCRVEHTSGTFVADLAASVWVPVDPGEAVPLATSAQSPAQEPVRHAAAGAVGSLAVAARADHIHPGVVPSSAKPSTWKSSLGGTLATGTPNATAFMWCTPIMVWLPESWDRAGVYVASGVTGSVLRLGVYADDGTGYPGALLAEWGTVSAATAGDKTLTISQSLSPGQYWLACAVQTAAPLMGMFTTPLPQLPMSTGGASPMNVSGGYAFTQNGVSGALPSVFTSTVVVTGAASPRVFVRVS